MKHKLIILFMPVLMGAMTTIFVDRSAQDYGIRIHSTVIHAPLLKSKSANPLYRIAIYVPPGAGKFQYIAVGCRISSESMELIDSLQIYSTGQEPVFDSSSMKGSVKPLKNMIEIPVDISARPGKHYLWLSAKASPHANIDKKAGIEVSYLVDKDKRRISVPNAEPNYAHRLGVVVKKANEDNIHTYRIPGLTRTSRSTLIAVYDNRYENSRDLPGNIDIGMSRSIDGGRSWEPMKVIMDMGPPHENNGIGDPAVLFDPASQKIFVAALWSKGNRSIAGSRPGLSPDETGQFMLVSSDDDGLSWTKPYSITPQVKDPKWHIYFNGPGMGIAMDDGTLVFASQFWDENGIPHSSIIYSKDNGISWTSGMGAKPNTTESQVVETVPGTLMLNMRDNRGRFRSVATTNDLGKTWTEHHTSYEALPDPVCMGSIIKARVNIGDELIEVLFFSNPATHSGRFNMTLKASLDLGETWLPENHVLIDERPTFGYSCLTAIDENTIGLLYEGIRELYFVRVPVQEVIKRME